MMNKIIFHFHLIISGIVLLFPSNSFASYKAQLIYDGNYLQKAEIQIFKGAEHISVKSAAVVLRGKIQWYPIAGKVILRFNNQKISFAAESKTAEIGTKNAKMNSPAKLFQGTLWVPLEFFLSESFRETADCKIDWDSENRILRVEPKTTISPPRIYARSNMARIILESQDEINPEIKKTGNTITIEIPRGRIGNEETIKLKDNLVNTIKISHARKGSLLKITLDDREAQYTIETKANPARMILEIFNPAKAETVEDKEELVEKIMPRISTSETSIPKPSIAKTEKNISTISKIVVDAGHGGHDPGAIGKIGTKEKEINLLIAIELARALRMEGYDVLLTRMDDTFVPLVDRTLFANDKKADLFISIHCNAAMRRKEGGFEIYFLAEEASDAHAETTAEFENAVESLESPLSPQKQRLHDLLVSMARTEFMNESSLFCQSISDGVKKRVPVFYRGVKRANFHVLHGAEMPSVLVECAFLTNREDEEKLRQRKFRSAIVDAIVAGVQNYERKVELLKK